MSGLRFKVGELAIIAVASPENVGKIVQIDAVGPFASFDSIPWRGGRRYALVDCDYFIGDQWIAHDWQLRKLDPPAEPASLTSTEECEVVA